MPIQRVGVIGAGTMGNGIAHVFARSGHDVVLCDVEQRFLDRGLDTIGKNLDREVAKNKITAADKATALDRITPVLERAKLSECQLVVEAATEKFEIKAEIFRDLDRLMKPDVLLALEHLLHFDYENRRSHKASRQSHRDAFLQSGAGDETGRGDPRAGDFAGYLRKCARSGDKLEKTPVEVNDAPGFVSDRVLMPLLNEAMYAVMEGVATAQAVDEVFKLGMAHPWAR